MSGIWKCFDYFGDPNAENQSWVCLNGSQIPERCFFLYHQQFFRRHSECDILEAIVSWLLLLCCIPANVASFISFYQRKFIRKEFLFLLAVYSICNVLMGIHGAMSGAFRLADNWNFGEWTCIISFNAFLVLMTVSMWIMTIISYERKICTCNNWNILNPNKSRLLRIVAMVAVLLVANIGSHVYTFFVLKVAKVEQVTVNRANYRVCTLFTKTTLRYLVDIVYFLITFLVPLLVNIYNYFKIWIYVRKTAKISLLDKEIIRQNKRREIRLALIVGLTLVIYVACTLPFHCVTFYVVAYDRYNGRRSQSSFYFAASLLIMLRTILSPIFMAMANRPWSKKSPCDNGETSTAITGAAISNQQFLSIGSPSEAIFANSINGEE